MIVTVRLCSIIATYLYVPMKAIFILKSNIVIEYIIETYVLREVLYLDEHVTPETPSKLFFAVALIVFSFTKTIHMQKLLPIR